MSCEDIRERLTAYLDGDLDPDRGTVVRGHLRTCEACRQVSADEAVLRDGLRRLPTVDPPPSLWANVQAALAAAEVQESQRPAWRRVLSKWLPSAPRLALGGAFAAAVIALVVWKVGPSSTATEPPAQVAGPAKPLQLTEHPSMEVQSSSPPRPPSAPSDGDATADLLAEPARITATYEATATELLALAKDARPGWTDDAKAAFDAKIASFRDELAGGDERARQRTYRAMIRYVQNAVVRDDIMLARAP